MKSPKDTQKQQEDSTQDGMNQEQLGIEKEDFGNNPYRRKEERKVVIQPYDYSVKGLLDFIEEGDMLLDPSYQRNYRWDDTKAARFIESLILNIPVPVVYLNEEGDGDYSVIDGQQRLGSLYRFVRASESEATVPEAVQEPLILEDLKVRSDLNGKTFRDLSREDQNAILKRHIRCIAILNESDAQLKFEVFERLNTGSAELSDQEVRNCVYRGPLNEALKEMATNNRFQQMISLHDDLRKKMKDVELVLRFFAYRELPDDYNEGYVEYLNEFMKQNQNLSDARLVEWKKDFERTVRLVHQVLGAGVAFRKPRSDKGWSRLINGAIYEAQMVAFSRLPANINPSDKTRLTKAAIAAFDNDDFLNCLFSATAQRKRAQFRSEFLTKKLQKVAKLSRPQ